MKKVKLIQIALLLSGAPFACCRGEPVRQEDFNCACLVEKSGKLGEVPNGFELWAVTVAPEASRHSTPKDLPSTITVIVLVRKPASPKESGAFYPVGTEFRMQLKRGTDERFETLYYLDVSKPARPRGFFLGVPWRTLREAFPSHVQIDA